MISNIAVFRTIGVIAKTDCVDARVLPEVMDGSATAHSKTGGFGA